MKYVGKTPRPRLPKEIAEKLRKSPGGGRHQDKKTDYQRRPKHPLRDKEE